ncbi:hypothetical protein NE237_022182 [Protea cynaroides]|uniref:AP2/ERF domain-containing protein n=1 Tax=Protea cynaroides TaxID=273540 RepID=A0A9Q0HCK7_9MAGN|nr:hypothetical protein NE237_022182 [Protea cynaroides]
MAQASSWLSFSLPPFEILRSCESQMLTSTPKLLGPFDSSNDSSQHHYFFEAFDAYEWPNLKPPQMPYAEENKEVKEIIPVPVSFNRQIQQQTVPKLEDFLGSHGNSANLVLYSDSQTETQESSNVYEQGSSLFGDQEPLKTIADVTTRFQAFAASNTGGSEVVEDSMSVNETQFACVNLQGNHKLMFSENPQVLSLAVTQNSASEKAIVPTNSKSSKKINDTFGQRTSVYRGVTKHRWTGRYEAHLWDNSCRREGQSRKGRQGGYDKEDKAARAYDLAALKYWGSSATTNFPVSGYTKELEEMKNMTRQEFIASLRRKSSGFSRGASIYRGVTRHHQQGRWQARIGRVAGNKDLYLGTFAMEEEAAEAYDIAAIKFRGVNAVTNFEMNRYDVEAIANSALPIGGTAKRLKHSLEASASREETILEIDHCRESDGEPQPLQCCGGSTTSNSSCVHNSIMCGLPFDVSTTSLHHQHQTNNGSYSDFSPNFIAPAKAMLLPSTSELEFCGRSFLYGITTPINISSERQ